MQTENAFMKKKYFDNIKMKYLNLTIVLIPEQAILLLEMLLWFYQWRFIGGTFI